MCSIVKEGKWKSAKPLKFGTGVYTHKGVYTFYSTMRTMFNLSRKITNYWWNDIREDFEAVRVLTLLLI